MNTEEIAMRLLCVSCFLTPAPPGDETSGEAADMAVCATALIGAMPIASASGAGPLRCVCCGAKLAIDRNKLARYGYLGGSSRA